ncbi:hypothetical protein ALI144C_38020 [Actinosynnema sp. ALI-1.44]|uniref:hypothetical protein n=1 Tax=Actinosynnema sp. ALI-1.44 TaxID=1933779 RepID=UPI00097C4ED8|nr:hypothetical protein [Actinosynnema sp. ALI-1.44]ONI74637.1 hypothetical protein ALI144C_38020 [Actinosynnema sp. ALI-1.44]
MGSKSSERGWEADPAAAFERRWGKSAKELTYITAGGDDDELSKTTEVCPDVWELTNGDVAVIGRDLTDVYRGRLPDGVKLAEDERVVVVPRETMVAAKGDIPDA